MAKNSIRQPTWRRFCSRSRLSPVGITFFVLTNSVVCSRTRYVEYRRFAIELILFAVAFRPLFKFSINSIDNYGLKSTKSDYIETILCFDRIIETNSFSWFLFIGSTPRYSRRAFIPLSTSRRESFENLFTTSIAFVKTSSFRNFLIVPP